MRRKEQRKKGIGAGSENKTCIMIYGAATLHTDYIRFFPHFEWLIGGGARGRKDRACLLHARRIRGFGTGFFFFFFFYFYPAGYCDTMNY